MNPDSSHGSPDNLEARLTALLLGELPAEQAAALQQALAQDPELARLHERLKQTIALVREAIAPAPTEQAAPTAPPLQLSPARREALLRQFQQGPAQPAARPQRKERSWLIPASIAAGLVVLAAASLLLPAGSKARAIARRTARLAALGAQQAEPFKEADRGVRVEWAEAKTQPATPVTTVPSPTPPSPMAQPPATRAFAKVYLPAPAEPAEAESARRFALHGQPQPAGQPSTWGGFGGFAGASGRAGAPPGAGALQPQRDQLQANQPVELAPLPIQFPAPTLKGTPAELPSGPHIEPLSDKPPQTRIVGLPDAAMAPGQSALAQATALPAASPPPARELQRRQDFYFGDLEAGQRDEALAEKKETAATLGETLVLGRSFETPKDTKPDAAPEKPLAGAVPEQTSAGFAAGPGQVVEADKQKATAPQGPESQRGTGPIYAVNAVGAVTIDGVTYVPGLSQTVPDNLRTSSPTASFERKVDIVLPQTATETLSRASGAASPLTRPSDTLSPTGGEGRGEGEARRKLAELEEKAQAAAEDRPAKRPAQAPIPQPEVVTVENPFSTFSLNVSDVSFKLAAASLEKGQLPDPATIRSEEFINAFDYRDPEPPPGVPIAFAWERARYPFAHNRELLRFALKTAARGRESGRPLNLVLLLDNSGSMERADRVRIIQECLLVLAAQLKPQDRLSVVTFARTARLWIDGRPGPEAARELEKIGQLTPQGGTNLEDALDLAYQTALRHYLAGGINRVVLLTDGAANLGNVDPEALKLKVETHRKQGVALDCFGIGWEGYNDDLLEVLSRNGDGRYGFVNTPEEAATEFAGQLAGALQVAASDVKVQVEFNPHRVMSWRQIGYAKHQLTKEQFRDNTVDAAEIAAAEAGNALYVVQVNPRGDGPLAIVRVRYKVPGTSDYREHEWLVPFTGPAIPLEQASPALRLAAAAGAFSEWLAGSPFAGEVTPDRLLALLRGVPEVFGADPRPKKLEWMIRQAKSIAGK